MNIIESERLIIREIESVDISCLLEIYQEPKNMEFIPNSQIKMTTEKLSEKYEKTNRNYIHGFGLYVVQLKQSKTIIGEAGFFDSYNELGHLELGYILGHQFWRNGYGTEVCQELINYGFNELKLHKITARIFSRNTASIRLSEKCGMIFIKEGLTDKNEYFSEYEILKTNKNATQQSV